MREGFRSRGWQARSSPSGPHPEALHFFTKTQLLSGSARPTRVILPSTCPLPQRPTPRPHGFGNFGCATSKRAKNTRKLIATSRVARSFRERSPIVILSEVEEPLTLPSSIACSSLALAKSARSFDSLSTTGLGGWREHRP